MTNMEPKPPYINLKKQVQKAISAHEAVHEGIATHAEKETASREEAMHKLRAGRGVTGELGHGK